MSTSAAGQFGTSNSDINLSIRSAQIINSMKYPWSKETFSSFPESKWFYRVESITDSIWIGWTWVTTRFIDPVTSVNIYSVLGFVVTGGLVFLILRQIGISRNFALFAGVLTEMLPWLRQNALFTASGTYYAVAPLALILFLLRNDNLIFTYRGFLKLISIFFIFSIFSAYSFFFSLYVLIIWLLFSWRMVYQQWGLQPNRSKAIIISLFSFLVFGAVFSIGFLLSQTNSEFGKPFGIYDVATVNANVNSLLGYLRPDAFHLVWPSSVWFDDGDDQNYGGIIVSTFAVFSLVLYFMNKLTLDLYRLIAVWIGLIILGLGRITILGFEIPSLRELARFVMPGIRAFSRVGMIVEIISIILFAVVVSYLYEQVKATSLKKVFVISIAVIAVLDFNPVSRRFFYNERDLFADIRSSIQSTNNGGLYVSRTSLDLVDYFGAPTFTDIYSMYPLAARGSSALSGFLVEIGVHSLIVDVDNLKRPYLDLYVQDSSNFRLFLDENIFKNSSDDVTLKRYNDDGSVSKSWTIRLVTIDANKAGHACMNCFSLAELRFDPPLEVSEPQLSRTVVQNRRQWSLHKTIEMNSEFILESRYSDKADSRFVFHLQLLDSYGNVYQNKVYIKNEGLVYNLLPDDLGWIHIIDDSPENVVMSFDDDCVVATGGTWGQLEGKNICFGIGDFWVEQINQS